MQKVKIILAVGLCLQIFAKNSSAGEESVYKAKDVFHPVIARNGIVASQEEWATKAGLEVLKQGGNAVDAAVTIGFTLAVTLPRAGNIAGGGFMLIHSAKTGETIAIDYREKAPLAAKSAIFQTPNGQLDPKKSRYSHLAVGVPGTVAGMTLALEKYGTISLARALQPAIELAEKGFPVRESLRGTLIFIKEKMLSSPASMEIFFKPGGVTYEEGEILIQKDLARSLKLIATRGADAFYRGEIADKIVADMKANGGAIAASDLAAYEPVIRQSLRGDYRGYGVYTMPPPSSGGVHLIQILNLLEKFSIGPSGHNSARTIHLMAESMKLAYADRFKFLGDPDFVSIPVARLISKRYADNLRSKISPYRATPSKEILPANPERFLESNETTHFSVIDRHGNAVANTYSLNYDYGTGITVPGTGILLNNHMDDFTIEQGKPNEIGIVGGELNDIRPGKRMLSTMTPVIVMKAGKPFLVTGSPGGSQIINAVAQTIVNVIDHQMNIAEATNALRVHHQWVPEQLQIEEGLNPDTIRLLKNRGYQIEIGNAIGSTQSVMMDDGRLYGASDPRRPGALTLGY